MNNVSPSRPGKARVRTTMYEIQKQEQSSAKPEPTRLKLASPDSENSCLKNILMRGFSDLKSQICNLESQNVPWARRRRTPRTNPWECFKSEIQQFKSEIQRSAISNLKSEI
jgi:hypothetical protein